MAPGQGARPVHCEAARLLVAGVAERYTVKRSRTPGGRNSVGRMPASQAGRRRFESGRPLLRSMLETSDGLLPPRSSTRGGFASCLETHDLDRPDIQPVLHMKPPRCVLFLAVLGAAPLEAQESTTVALTVEVRRDTVPVP